MCSNDNWMGILGGLAAATAILASTYAENHSVHTQPQAAPAHVSAPAVSGERAALQTQTQTPSTP